MSQGSTGLPTVGTHTGLEIVNDVNAAFQALQSMNSGASAPANDISAAAVEGQQWGDTSVAGKFKAKLYDGAAWCVIGTLDTVNHLWQPVVGGGVATLASASTTDLGSVDPAAVTISGTTAITSFGSSAVTGQLKFLKFSGALTLTYNATSLVLPTAANIVTSAGDTAIAKCLNGGSGNWEIIQYTRASGAALVASLSTIPFPAKMHNGTLVVSVAANAMTIALKTLAGADPSAGDPVLITVPNLTGGYSLVTVTAALSITVPSGATLATVNGQTSRIWIGYTKNGGTDVLSVYNCLAGSAGNYTFTPWREEETETGTAITSGATSAATWYSSSAFSTLPVAVLGYVESTQTTAGTWATAPSKVVLYGPGVKKPGETAQEIIAQNSTLDGTTSLTFVVFTHSEIGITPKSLANLVRIEAIGSLDVSGPTNTGTIQLSRGTTPATNLIGVPAANALSGGTLLTTPAMLVAYDLPGGSQTYAVQGKNSNASSTTQFPAINGAAGTALLTVREIQV